MSNLEEYGEFPLKDYLQMEIGGEDGVAVARLELGDQHMNPNGVVHGAVLFALADTAMGRATMSVLDEGQFCATVELQLRFIRPASNGLLAAHTKVVKKGRAIVHLDSQITDQDDRLIATATGTFAVIAA